MSKFKYQVMVIKIFVTGVQSPPNPVMYIKMTPVLYKQWCSLNATSEIVKSMFDFSNIGLGGVSK